MSLKWHHCLLPNTIGPQRSVSPPIVCILTQNTIRWARVIGPNVWRLLNLMRQRAVGVECNTANNFSGRLAEAEILHFMFVFFSPERK